MNKRVFRILLLFVFFDIIIGFCLTMILGCKQWYDEPFGTSTMSAKINGVPKTFSSILAGDYFGKGIRGSCDSNFIDLRFGYSVGGWCTWSAHLNEYSIGVQDTTAYLNNIRAIPGIGGFEIKTINKAMREYSGIFEFSVFDTLRNDTIRVTEGKFDVYCPSQG